jgi:nucleoside-diphosphate-sugar epimerase/intein/homing endonuclease
VSPESPSTLNIVRRRTAQKIVKWSSQRVIVTGGAGFIGSNMVDALLTLGAEVVVVDKLQLSSGSLAWNKKLIRLEEIFKKHGIEKIPLEICDLESDKQKFQIIAKDCDAVFHLSAVFGGREFVDTRQADCSKMLSIDHNVIDAAYAAGVERFAYASSACFPAGTKVWTPEGKKNIEDIVEGDELVDHLGCIGRVSGVSARPHSGTVKRVWITGFNKPIDATPEHPFLIENKGKTKWTPAEEVTKGSRVLIPRVMIAGRRPTIDLRPMMSDREIAYTKARHLEGASRQATVLLLTTYGVQNPEGRYYGWMKYGEKPVRFRAVEGVHSTIDVDPDVAWWLGLYVAEGWTEGERSPSQIVISLGNEPELEARALDVASKKLGLEMHRRGLKGQQGVKLEATHPLLAEWLAENFGNRARGKRIPNLMLQADEETVRNFLRGYIEGDGCVSKRSEGRRPRILWSTVSKDLSAGLQVLVARLGLSPGYGRRKAVKTVQDRKVNSVEPTQSYLDGWQSVDLLRQLDMCPPTMENSPKYQRARKVVTSEGEWISRLVRKVEDVPFQGLVYNCEVTPNHSYLVNDGIAVHNCVYPDSLQKDPEYLLKESDILSTGEGWLSADNLYGFAKLMGELQCIVFHKEKGMKTSACRYLTVYGPGEYDTSHAISALIEKGLDKMDPYVVWGSGNQQRGFTYVTDIVKGSILASEKITDGTAINLGWDKRYTIKEVAEMILKITKLKSKMAFDKSKPEGPFSRALDISLAKKLTGWVPKVDLYEGLEKTIAWHKTLRDSPKSTRKS